MALVEGFQRGPRWSVKLCVELAAPRPTIAPSDKCHRIGICVPPGGISSRMSGQTFRAEPLSRPNASGCGFGSGETGSQVSSRLVPSQRRLGRSAPAPVRRARASPSSRKVHLLPAPPPSRSVAFGDTPRGRPMAVSARRPRRTLQPAAQLFSRRRRRRRRHRSSGHSIMIRVTTTRTTTKV